ncbi:hypothetical protein V491_01191 [Pseudogymnoascus sp. VKM F-3775]|nr:hypothetical protein V491_01191 [Pseudogymnoascus sp. VKM F-3775]
MDTISATIEASLHRLTEQQRRDVCKDPKALLWLYTDAFVQAVACHIELFRREWNILYEPYANISTVYGSSVHRDRVRRLAKEYSQHLRYLNTSLEILRRHLPSKAGEGAIDPGWSPNSVSSVGTLISDLAFLVQDLEALKSSCNQFLEQQVSRLSLKEARMSIQEAKDLKRLSYVAFVFAPLSLASSFFGMNVQPLDGSTPLWIFIVIALATLFFSTGIIILASSAGVLKWWSYLKGATHIIFHERNKPFQTNTENQDGDDGKTTAGHTVSTTTTQVLQESFTQNNTVEISAVEVKTEVHRQPAVTRAHSELPASGRGLHGKIPTNDRLRRQLESQVRMESTSVYIPQQRTEYEDPPSDPRRRLPTIMSSRLITPHISTTRSQASTSSSRDSKNAPSVRSTKSIEDGVRIRKSPESQAISDHIPDDTKEAPPNLDARSQRSSVAGQIATVVPEKQDDGESDTWTADSVKSDEIGQITTVVSEKQDDDESNSMAANSVKSDDMHTRLYNAFLNGDELRIQELFDTGNCDPNSILRFASYMTLICRAAHLGKEKIVRLLLERGADPNLENEPPSTFGGKHLSALAEAAEHGNPSLVRLLLDAGADVDGYGVVYAAAHSGSLDTLKLLIEAGADINVENTCGYCFSMGHSGEPLGVAAHMGHTEVVRFLLESKITLDHVLIPSKSKGEDALGAACQAGKEEAAFLINDAGVAMSYLNVRHACSNDCVAVLKRYIALNPGCCLPRGVLAKEISYAAEYGHVGVVKVVLEHGADIEIRDKEVVTILLDNGANLTEVTHPEGMTALHFAARGGYGDIVELLLKRGADITSGNQAGESPFHVAAREGKLAAVRVLIGQKGVNIRAKDNEGWVAAHRAAWNGHRDVLQLLMARDAHLDALTPEGFTVEALLEAYEG